MIAMSHQKALSSSLRIVITGTGTGVGKTFVSTELLAILTEAGVKCLGLKPIETGFTEPERSDAEALARGARHPRLTPAFTSPVPESPHRAARRAGVALDAQKVADWVALQTAAAAPDAVVVESAGGLFTPVGETVLNVDLVRALEPCTFVLVVPDRLGALNDVLCSVTAARAVHRAPDLLCMNLLDEGSVGLENTRELSRLGTLPPVIQAPLLRFNAAQDVVRLFHHLRQ